MTTTISALPPRRYLLLLPLLAMLMAAASAMDDEPAEAPTTNLLQGLIIPEATRKLIHWIQTYESPEGGGFYSEHQKEFVRNGRNLKELLRNLFADNDLASDSDIPDFETFVHTTHSSHPLSIPEGTVLLKLPRSALLGGGGHKENDDGSTPECRLIRLVYREVAEKGADSKFAPHLRYLGLLEEEGIPLSIPAVWSEAGQKMLQTLGHLPPLGIEGPLELRAECLEGLGDRELAKRVAAVVAAHGASGEILTEHGLLVPLLDNYHYAHCGNTHRTANPNARIIAGKGWGDWGWDGKYFGLETTQTINKEDQICRSFDAPPMTEMERLVNLGIGNTLYFPKTFRFRPEGLDSPVDVEVYWLGNERKQNYIWQGYGARVKTENPRTEEYYETMAIYLEDELHRLEVFAKTEDDDAIPDAEFEAVMKQHKNLVLAMQLAYETLENEELEEEDQGVGSAGEL